MLELIIVLGNSKPEVMKKRVDRAIIVFNSSKYTNFEYEHDIVKTEKRFIISGTEYETMFMQNYLFEKGIDEKSIIVENKSKTTIQNIQNSLDLMEKMLLNISSIVICSSSFHIGRVIVISGLIMTKYAPIVKYVHTNEKISDNERDNEQMLISLLLNNYISSNCN